MTELISGKEALMALGNGEEVEFKTQRVGKWVNIKDIPEYKVTDFLENKFYDEFRRKPRTITLNGVELNRCYSLGIDRIKNEVAIQFKDESDAEILHDLLARLYGFKG